MAAKKNSPGYWEQRIASRTWEIYNSAEEKNRKLIEMYKDASTAVTNELYRLAEKLQKQGFTRTDTWRKNQLVKLNKEFLREIKKLGGDVESFSNESMYDAFRENYENITEMLGGVDVVLPNKKAMEKMMSDPWRGSDFSSRLWENTKKLSYVLNDTLRHGIQQGKNITEIAVELDAKMQQGFNVAHRLVRTETMHTLNTSSLEGYKASGVEKVQFWAAEDERTCDLCGKLHGKVYNFDKAPVLPLHPNCRCTYLPVMENKDYSKKPLKSKTQNGILQSENPKEVATVHTIGKINKEIYKCITEDIITDEVIITNNQIQHIKDRHPNDYERFASYFREIVREPDYIIEANKPNTALVLKKIKIENEVFKTVLRLATSKDNPQYKNSIITFMKIDEKEWNRLLRNKKILYIKE